MTRAILVYGVALAVLALLLGGIRYFYFVRHLPVELLILLLAALFTGLGVWAGRRLSGVPGSRANRGRVNHRALDYLGLTARELQVLQLMAEGCSNKEIAAALFVSVNTVKSHVSSLLAKLEVRRRTQAVRKGHSLGLVGISPERTN